VNPVLISFFIFCLLDQSELPCAYTHLRTQNQANKMRNSSLLKWAQNNKNNKLANSKTKDEKEIRTGFTILTP
jgi:hypothetical protein